MLGDGDSNRGCGNCGTCATCVHARNNARAHEVSATRVAPHASNLPIPVPSYEVHRNMGVINLEARLRIGTTENHVAYSVSRFMYHMPGGLLEVWLDTPIEGEPPLDTPYAIELRLDGGEWQPLPHGILYVSNSARGIFASARQIPRYNEL